MASRDQSIELSRWHQEIATRTIHPDTFSAPRCSGSRHGRLQSVYDARAVLYCELTETNGNE